MNEKTFNDLILFWRDVEALSPQEIPKSTPNDRKEPTRDCNRDTPPPWLDDNFKRREIPPEKAWRHTVYAGMYERSAFIECLEKSLGKQSDVFEERPTGQSCVFVVASDENGRLLLDTFVLSMAAWAFGFVETHGLSSLTASTASDTVGLHADDIALAPTNSGLRGFDRQQDSLREELAWRFGNQPVNTPIDGSWITDFVNVVIDKCNLHSLIPSEPGQRIKSVQVRRPTREDVDTKPKTIDDFLNSFFIKDLHRLIMAGLGGAGAGLRLYLEPAADLARHDVRKNRTLSLNVLNPQCFPEGCWPAEYPLVWSQQVAVNAIWESIKQSTGIFAVNGPPGTGKTTLLRDLVAAIVVERAKVLAERGRALLGEKKRLRVGNSNVPYHDLGKELSGYSIVVASSNNDAVENVSLELPKKTAIHKLWSTHVDVYRDIASKLLGQPAWAMISGRLGNSANRDEFVNRFWWGTGGENGTHVSGLRERLEAIGQGSAEPVLQWAEAVERFRNSLADENSWRIKLTKLANLPLELGQLRDNRSKAEQEQANLTRERSSAEDQLQRLMDEVADFKSGLTRQDKRIGTLKEVRPGFLDWISSWGKSHRQWRADLQDAMAEFRRAEDLLTTAKDRVRDIRKNLLRMHQRDIDLTRAIQDLAEKARVAEKDLNEGRATLGKHWPDMSAAYSEQEKSSPWACEEWRGARIRVFLSAMNLHRAFVENNAKKMMANLGLAMDVLKGKIPDGKTRKIALDSLALVCPAISTTFASVTTLFSDLGAESIGWLLIDEAGQATPQAAAGAVWRTRRVVVVGDPLQLKPVVTLPRSIEASLAVRNGNVADCWHPSGTSVQILADRTTPIGTTIGEGAKALWVGAPLRVHYRCDDPMFSISNTIAYDELMVHHKKSALVDWPASAWIDVPKAGSEGNWIPEEGEELKAVLQNLINVHRVPRDDIFLISPFRDVVRQLKSIGKTYGLNQNRVGTVHKTQGKEAAVVIMLLGGSTARARDWVASAPNLLNVAASRAKARFYVIGDRKDWASRPYFSVLSRYLN